MDKEFKDEQQWRQKEQQEEADVNDDEEENQDEGDVREDKEQEGTQKETEKHLKREYMKK